MSFTRNSVIAVAACVLLAAGSFAVSAAGSNEAAKVGIVFVRPGTSRAVLRESASATAKETGKPLPNGKKLRFTKVWNRTPASSVVDWYYVDVFGFGTGWVSAKDTVQSITLKMETEVRRIPLPSGEAAQATGAGAVTALTTAARGFDKRAAEYAKGLTRNEAFLETVALYDYFGVVFRDPPYPRKYQGRLWRPGTFADTTAPGRLSRADEFSRAESLVLPPENTKEAAKLGFKLTKTKSDISTGFRNLDRILELGIKLVGARQAVLATVDKIKPVDERAIGQAAAIALVSSSDGLVLQDEALANYVADVGNFVAQHGARQVKGSDGKARLKARRFHFGVLRRKDPNAFSTAGGHVFITTELLNRVQSEAELAFVLAHEIAHIDNEDGLKALKAEEGLIESLDLLLKDQLKGTKIASTPVKSFLKEQDVFAKFADALVRVTERVPSFEVESDADKLALAYVMAAGYDAKAAVGALDALEVPTTERKAALAEQLANAPVGKDGFDRFQRDLVPRLANVR